jgi:hypothetical protein
MWWVLGGGSRMEASKGLEERREERAERGERARELERRYGRSGS